MDEERAVWTTAYVNDLPDGSFLYVEPGGEKDEDGKTVPRTKRHFPYKDASGAVDLPHLRNALARIPQSSLPASVKERLTTKAQRILERANGRAITDATFEVRSAEMWPDVDYEMRAIPEGLELTGYAAVFGLPSLPMSFSNIQGGRRFREVIHPGAFSRSLNADPDVTLRYQHNLTTLPLGRTKSGTLTLTEDERGLFVRDSLPDNEWGRPIRDAVLRRDITGMSFRFQSAVEDWAQDADGTHVRHLREVKLGAEVSITDFPAYPDTSVAVRYLAEEADLEPDELAEAFRALRDPEARLTAEQHHLLMAAITSRVDDPFVGPRLARARERLAAFAK